jgi:hypothetical protein
MPRKARVLRTSIKVVAVPVTEAPLEFGGRQDGECTPPLSRPGAMSRPRVDVQGGDSASLSGYAAAVTRINNNIHIKYITEEIA